MTSLSPANLWVLVDEEPNNIDDGCFNVAMTLNTRFIEAPAMYHNSGCDFAFGDAHVEFHKWVDSRTKWQPRPVPITLNDNPDVLWMHARTSVKVR